MTQELWNRGLRSNSFGKTSLKEVKLEILPRKGKPLALKMEPIDPEDV